MPWLVQTRGKLFGVLSGGEDGGVSLLHESSVAL